MISLDEENKILIYQDFPCIILEIYKENTYRHIDSNKEKLEKRTRCILLNKNSEKIILFESSKDIWEGSVWKITEFIRI